jgi:deoxyribodipyrimidine photo-lyase
VSLQMKNAETTNGVRPALVLFRNDLRLADNRALSAAAASGRPVICAFIFDTAGEIRRPVGAARRWWLHKSLEALQASLAKAGASLVLRSGPGKAEVRKLVQETGAGAVFWNRHYEPLSVAFDTKLKAGLRADGIEAESFEGELLHEPTQVKTGAGGAFRVYSPFWRALEAGPEPRDPLPAPTSLKSWSGHVDGVSLESLALLPTTPDWAGGMRENLDARRGRRAGPPQELPWRNRRGLCGRPRPARS